MYPRSLGLEISGTGCRREPALCAVFTGHLYLAGTPVFSWYLATRPEWCNPAGRQLSVAAVGLEERLAGNQIAS